MAFAVITILLLGLTLLLLLSLGFLPRETATSFQRSKELARSLTNDFALSIYFGWIKLRMTYDSLVGRKKLRAHQLREWAKKELAHKDELHSWLSQLPDSGFEAVSEGVSRHCRDFNISLEWLFSREMNVVNHKEAISLFSVYQDLVDSSRLKQTIELRRSVFKKVISLGLVDPVPAYDLIMSSELERQHIAAAALRNAATKDWNQFAQALSIVLLQNQQSEP
jgi:hypothetical protein